MRSWLRERSSEPELMDNFTIGGAELQEALAHLRLLNRIFAAASPTVYGVRRLWRLADKPKRLTIMDVGSGSGDANAQLLKWASAAGVDLSITLIDITEEACQEARDFFRNEPRVHVAKGDLFTLTSCHADIVTGTQFFHHFSDAELPNVAASMLKLSRLGIVINDIHRHWLPWCSVWLTTRMLSNNRYILHDGPLSVAKGFRSHDWDRLKAELGSAVKLHYSWRALFRYAVVIEKIVE
ncbi:hypothetical protein PAECIP111893_02942 [Paenibacillus plantiphilus]|uniref:Methyltransferase domain-containing protein n=1 Tax=Paenibacillus plantiphilus TaxID=2905650 RepID=A0ABN8GPW2_9BACL|nr:methyltransferase domain-containing protein [Paenibacillus plantiphilus]CAH1208949.1 hypothetical protein PAECIP111893_02942 [Paenibacillus plantiphilus]